jgi:hypothetical protein
MSLNLYVTTLTKKLASIYGFDAEQAFQKLADGFQFNPNFTSITGQSQKHGFTFENSVREQVFEIPSETNNTDRHDIPKHKNHFDENENCSIKTTGSMTICCGDILRFYDYDFNEKNTIIVIVYKQTALEKIIKCIYEINYNAECHKFLFGDLPKEVIQDYVKKVKAIPRKTKDEQAKDIFDYLDEKNKIKKEYPHIIQINPKVNSSNRRVQCSIPNFEKTLSDFITYKSSPDTPNLLRGKEITPKILSTRRKRNQKLT